jgi:hypothetical protein
MELVAVLLYFSVPAAAMLYGAVVSVKRQRKLNAELRRRAPAFAETLSLAALRSDPEGARARLGDKVTTVVATTAPVFTGGSSAGGDVFTRYTSFVIDTKGESHDLEVSEDADAIVQNARWVAELFGVPLESDAPGDDGQASAGDGATDADPEVAAMEARLRTRRMALGAGALVSGLGLWLFTGYIYWLPYVTYQEELAAYEAKSAAVSATVAAVAADPDAEVPEGSADDLLSMMFTSEPTYETHPLAIATLPMMIGGLALMFGGASMLRRARAEARIARESR